MKDYDSQWGLIHAAIMYVREPMSKSVGGLNDASQLDAARRLLEGKTARRRRCS